MPPTPVASSRTVPIPARAHFVWCGEKPSALLYLSIRAALDRGGLAEVWLWATDRRLADDPWIRDLGDRPGFALQWRDDLDDGLATPLRNRLDDLEKRQPGPAGRADLIRLRVLKAHGGLYLDADAITLRNLSPLLQDQGFAGLERVALPADLVRSKSPVRWVKAGVLLAARDLASRTRHAQALFRTVEQHYSLACNNAVLGAHKDHPLINNLLERAARLPDRTALKLYELGPRLLEDETGNRSQPGFRLHDPLAFYPLAPEICWDYVRDDPDGRLALDQRTFAAHLYDSVLARRLGRPLDAAWLVRSRDRTLLGRMVAPYLDDLARIQR